MVRYHLSYCPRDAEVYPCHGRLKYLRGLHIRTIKKTKTWKSSWPGQTQTNLLKELCEEIVLIKWVIFERSIRTGKLPTEWCRAQVSPIFKKGDKTSAANYRLISLTCILCKVIAHIIASHLVKHFDKHDLLYDALVVILRPRD